MTVENKEPVTLPVKFPLLLAQGVEGIAVGLASKILPHNFIELIDACIDQVNGIVTPVYPDFLTGGFADISRYNDGMRGGRVRIRAKITQLDKKTLLISEVPFGTTTSSLIDTILNANEKGKIKIRKIDDNTAGQVEILIHLTPGVSPDQTIDALYAFTDCEITVSTNACVIEDGKPRFAGVKDILAVSVGNILDLLQKELEIRKAELLEHLLFSSLEKIFIEKRIYRKIEECTTWEDVISTIDAGLEPYKKKFYRIITTEDILKLTEIKIKRISKFDSFKADEAMRKLEEELSQVQFHLDHLKDYAIEYLTNIRNKYGKGRERKTELRNFDNIEATLVAAATQKLYVNRVEGFAGTSLKKDEYVSDCSDIDDIIVIREDGTFIVTKVSEKVFVGENVLHIAVFKRNDERTIYNLVYQDGRKGKVMVKRFDVLSVTRDKEYCLTRGTPDSRILYLTVNPNGEAEVINVLLKPRPRLKKPSYEYDFSKLDIKGRGSIGVILSKFPVKKITKKEEGVSTLRARDIWFDDVVMRLNAEGRGIHVGAFEGEDKILTIYQSGYYRLTGFDLSTHFEEGLLVIQKYKPARVITAIYLDGPTGLWYVKRFIVEPVDKKVDFIDQEDGSKLLQIWVGGHPKVEFSWEKKGKIHETVSQELDLDEFIAVKGWKAKGKKLCDHEVIGLTKIELPDEEVEEIEEAIDLAEEPDMELPGLEVENVINEEEDTKTIETPELHTNELTEINIKSSTPEPRQKRKKPPPDESSQLQITLDL